jgi:CHRD domain
MRTRLIYLILVVSTVALTVSAFDTASADSQGGRKRFTTILEGPQENPSISTVGTGRASLHIDEDEEVIHFELSYSNLEGGAVLFAHIHLSQQGVNGGIMAFFCGGGGKPACPQPEGTVTGTIRAADITGPAGQGVDPGEPTAFEELVRAIRQGVTYANVHTTRWSGGEIRGQFSLRQDD